VVFLAPAGISTSGAPRPAAETLLTLTVAPFQANALVERKAITASARAARGAMGARTRARCLLGIGALKEAAERCWSELVRGRHGGLSASKEARCEVEPSGLWRSTGRGYSQACR